MRRTIKLIGRAIKQGQEYLPIRNHAASLATLADPKDYLGQARNIYNDIIKRWRYVKDPVRKELLTYGPKALATLVLNLDGRGVGRGKGAGDCDCVAAATGALLESIGIHTRIAVTAPPKTPPGPLFAHVFIQAKIPNKGWVTVDPVVHPKYGFGHTPVHSRIAFFSLSGQLLGHQGNVTGLRGLGADKGDEEMSQYYGQIPDLTQWQDVGLGDDGEGFLGEEPEDFRMYGIDDFGAYSDMLGIMSGEGLGLAAEVTPQLYGSRVLARTPMLELSPRDYKYMKVMRRPYDGMMALGDDGAVYEYDGLSGFFSRIRKAVKKVARRVRKGIRKVIKKIPGGKYLLKLGKKIWKVAKKFVRPLAKFVGKYATKLAPIAALIPGYGPAIAAGLYTAGHIAKFMNRVGAVVKAVKGGGVSKLVFPSGKAAKIFQATMKKAANWEKNRQRRGGKIPPMRGARRRVRGRGRRRGGSRALMAKRAQLLRRMRGRRRLRRR
jgi:hypothetical protein